MAARSESFLNGSCGIHTNDLFFSTERLRSRMRAEGLGESFIRDCEKIIQAEFSQHFAQMRARYEDYLSFLGTFPQQMEVQWLSSDLLSLFRIFCFLFSLSWMYGTSAY